MKNAEREEKYYLKPHNIKVSKSRFNLDWCEELGCSPKVVFDCGSCDMGDAIRFKERFNCDVYAFEASPVRYEFCKKLSEIYDIPVYNYIICDNDQPRMFYESYSTREGGVDAQGSIFEHTEKYKAGFNFIEQTHQVSVPTKNIAQICAELNCEPDVLHIDIEGAELLAIKGLGNVRPKIVYMETITYYWHGFGPDEQEELKMLMSTLGYDLKLDLGADKLYALRNS